MKQKRVLVLMHELLVPPDSLSGFSDEQMMTWKTEFDVCQTLRMMGHDIFKLGASDDLMQIITALNEYKPHVCFNLLEEFHGVGTYDQHVPGVLELLKRPYTGCRPRGLMLSHDKVLAKKLFKFHNIPTPKFEVVPVAKKVGKLDSLQFPLIVKSVLEDASLGITNQSVVQNREELEAQVLSVHKTLKTDALVEEYISGREFYVGVLGNARLQVLPIWELVFKNAPEKEMIATAEVKWDQKVQLELGVETHLADIPVALKRKIDAATKQVYNVLGLTGYARIDFRLNEKGEFFVLEANPNPNLSFGEDFAESAEKAGLEYSDLIDRILALGISYKQPWKQ